MTFSTVSYITTIFMYHIYIPTGRNKSISFSPRVSLSPPKSRGTENNSFGPEISLFVSAYVCVRVTCKYAFAFESVCLEERLLAGVETVFGGCSTLRTERNRETRRQLQGAFLNIVLNNFRNVQIGHIICTHLTYTISIPLVIIYL